MMQLRKRPNFLGRLILKTAGISWADEGYWSSWTPAGSTLRPGDSDMQKSVGDGTSLDVIMSPVLWIARRMMESPIGIRRVDDPELHFDHDVAVLLKYPTPWYAGSTLRFALAINFLMDGNGYMRKIRDTHDKPVALLFLPSWTIEPVTPLTGKGYIDEYQYNPGGIAFSPDQSKTTNIPARDIVHLRFGLDPNNTRKGISPLKILLREIYTDSQGAVMTAMLLKNAGLIGMIFSPKQGSIITKPDQVKREVKEEFKDSRMGSPMVFTAPTDVNYFGAEAAKMDLSALREIPEERICSLLAIPAAVVGFGTGMQQTKVGATLQELRLMAYEDCIIPTQNSWCDELDIQLVPDFEESPKEWHCQFDNSAVRVLQDDENRTVDRLVRELNGGGIMLSEYREARGREVGPEHEVFFIPMSAVVTPASDVNTPVMPPPAPTPSPSDDSKKSGVELKAVQGRMTPTLSRLTHRLFREGRTLQRQWQSQLSDEFKAYGKHIADIFASVAARREAKAAAPDWNLIGEEALQDAGPLTASFGPHYLRVARMTFESINTVLNLGVSLTDFTQMAIIRRGGKRMGLIDFSAQSRQALFEAITEAREAGEGAAGIVARILDKVPAGPWTTPEIRAQVIARTETKYAQNYSSLEAYRSSETISNILIFDAQLGPTDAECEQLNGQVVSLEEAQFLMETEHPNGTRSMAPYMDERGSTGAELGHAAVVPE